MFVLFDYLLKFQHVLGEMFAQFDRGFTDGMMNDFNIQSNLLNSFN